MVANLPGAQAGQNIYVDFCYRCYIDENGKCKMELYMQRIYVTPCVGCDHDVVNDTSWYFQMAKGKLADAMAKREPPFAALSCCVPEDCYQVITIGHAKCVLRMRLEGDIIYITNCNDGGNCKTTFCYCGDGQVEYADCNGQYSYTTMDTPVDSTKPYEFEVCKCFEDDIKKIEANELFLEQADLNHNGIIEPNERNVKVLSGTDDSVCEE